MLQWLYNIDKEILLAINHHFNPLLDNIMWFASGTASWFPLYAFLITILIIKLKKQSWLIILLVIPLVLISDQLASAVFKPLVCRFRPSHTPGLEYALHYVKNYQGGSYGFYSSHASNTFGLAVYLSVVASKYLKWIPWVLFPWSLFVCYSRIYLGVHFPSDVFFGIIMGTLIAWFISWIYFRIISYRQQTALSVPSKTQ